MLPDVASSSTWPGPEQPAALAVLDHRERGAILHRAAGVVELELRVDLDPGLRLEGLETDERRIADSGSGGRSRV